jgi:hypothetical protein
LISTYGRSATLLQTTGDIPSALVGHASALVRKIMVVWGGRSNTTGRADNAVYLLELGMCDLVFARLSINPLQDKDPREWTRVVVRGHAPLGRSGHAVAIIDCKFFVFGGQAGGKRLNDLWMLDLSSGNPIDISSLTLYLNFPYILLQSQGRLGNNIFLLNGPTAELVIFVLPMVMRFSCTFPTVFSSIL